MERRKFIKVEFFGFPKVFSRCAGDEDKVRAHDKALKAMIRPFEEKALPGWHDFRFLADRLRAEDLQKEQTK